MNEDEHVRVNNLTSQLAVKFLFFTLEFQNLLKMKKSNRLFRELMEIESKKRGVWDERKSNLGYRDHLKAIESAEKKVDDNSPLIRSMNFFKQSKYTTQQRQIEQRINANVDIVIKLNKLLRKKVTFVIIENCNFQYTVKFEFFFP